MGSEYCGELEKGLTAARWCDRYENRGKQSGAFSCGSYEAEPYILMNYQPDVLDHVFTLAHEAGHSMHSRLSAKNQPFIYYDYVIFVAEVASTFNEQLLSKHLLEKARDDTERAFLINRQIDAIRGTLIRQTMFAEFEKIAHASAESGEPLTLDKFKEIYRELLKLYFGPDFALDDELSLECLRIPHFYRAFYVYKYATGISAAMALADRVLNGGEEELTDYLNFLKGGCSKDPLDLLRAAGVDMEQPDAVETALERVWAVGGGVGWVDLNSCRGVMLFFDILQITLPVIKLMGYYMETHSLQSGMTHQIYWITRRIAQGRFATRERASHLRNEGITHILNVGESASIIKANDYGFKDDRDCPVADFQRIPEAVALTCLDALHEMLLVKESKVYIHCVAGQNRSPTILWLYLVACGMPPAVAKFLITNHTLDAVPGHSQLVDDQLIAAVVAHGAKRFLPLRRISLTRFENDRIY